MASASGRRFFVGGNWKMNYSKAILEKVNEALGKTKDADVDIVCAPPALFIKDFVAAKPSHVQVAAQNCYHAKEGAFTGELSPEMLKEAGCTWVILGHSERRTLFNEDDEFLKKKIDYVLNKTDINVIACIGETLQERESGKTNEVVERQVKSYQEKIANDQYDRVVIAYEPIWAIGTGKVATPQQAQEVHEHLRKFIEKSANGDIAKKVRIIYGGSVTGSNCKELAQQSDIDGFLVGGASLKPEFEQICKARQN
jgi:triosephosphate isomerase